MPQSYHYRPGQSTALNFSTTFALIFHGLVIFGIGLAASPLVKQNQQLEVALSIAKSDYAPEDAEFIAETNQIGSGTLEETAELTTTEQAQFRDNKVKPSHEVFMPASAQPIEAIPELKPITTIGESEQSVALNEIEFLEYQRKKQNLGAGEFLEMLDLSISSMEAKVSDALQAETKKPRSLILDSSSTLAAEDAAYVRAWRDRVESVGNSNYPEEARNNKLYGNVRMLVTVLASGELGSIRILQTSGHAPLDTAAIRSVQLASPFEPFHATLAEKYDQIEIVRTWQFSKDRVSSKI